MKRLAPSIQKKKDILSAIFFDKNSKSLEAANLCNFGLIYAL